MRWIIFILHIYVCLLHRCHYASLKKLGIVTISEFLFFLFANIYVFAKIILLIHDSLIPTSQNALQLFTKGLYNLIFKSFNCYQDIKKKLITISRKFQLRKRRLWIQ